MVLTTSSVLRETLILSLVCLCTMNSGAQAQSNSGGNAYAKNPNWVADAATVRFPQAPLHGQIDGIDFKPVVAEKVFMRSRTASAGVGKQDGVDKLSFKDGDGRQIDVTIYGPNKFEDVVYTQTLLSPLKGASALGVAIDLRNLSRNDFGIHISLGKFSAAKTQPVYVVFRLDSNNWLEGYTYAQMHDRVLF